MHPFLAMRLCTIAALFAFAVPATAAVSEADKKSGVVECTGALLKSHNPGLAGDDDRIICFEVTSLTSTRRSATPSRNISAFRIGSQEGG